VFKKWVSYLKYISCIEYLINESQVLKPTTNTGVREALNAIKYFSRKFP
jgi:hypothetical protein